MITVRKVLTDDASNILSGTELQSIPEPGGTLEIYAASSQADTNITIFRPGGELLVYNRPITQRTGGVIEAMNDNPYEMEVSPGEAPQINIDMNTAATIMVEVTLTFPDEQ